MSAGPLRQALMDAAEQHGVPLKDLTVLAAQNDPFRIDTDARHRDGEWLAVTARNLGLGDRRIHLRGLHYMVIGVEKPNDGGPYTNTEKDWLWLSEDAGKAARWLGYLSFDQIIDNRNTPPVVRIFERPDPESYITVGIDVRIPDIDDIVPTVDVIDFDGVQPYKLVMIGEKSSLDAVLAPIASEYRADLYLPTGEPSDTMLHQMAQIGAQDGRPMVVLYFSDCDPSGWQMPVSVARKLQALKVLLFPDLQFQVRRVALTPDQVREYGLPSTPLKDTELRGDRWREAMGVDQTEIDALASLRPDVLRRLAREAIKPFFDDTLDRRVFQARGAWIDAAQEALNEQANPDTIGRVVMDAERKLEEMRQQIDELNNRLRFDADDFDLPDIVIPEAEPYEGVNGSPLLDSTWPFIRQTRRLIDSKAYRSQGDES